MEGLILRFLDGTIRKLLEIRDEKKRRNEIREYYNDQALKFEIESINERNSECIELLFKSCNIINKIPNFYNRAKAHFRDLMEDCPRAYNLLLIFYSNKLEERIWRVWHLCSEILKEKRRITQNEIDEIDKGFDLHEIDEIDVKEEIEKPLLERTITTFSLEEKYDNKIPNFIIIPAVRKYVNSKSYNLSSEVLNDTLNKVVKNILDKSIDKVKAQKRYTIKASDVPL